MAWISPDDVWLTEAQSLQNAQLVANHFAGKWTPQAISALCGNMRHESSINPNIWEYGYGHSLSRGYGLVQWTPASKYIDWTKGQGLEWSNGDSQLARIDYEQEKGIQWIKTSSYNLSFNAFTKSTKSIDYLTQAFTWNYERPNRQAGQESTPARIAFAKKCLNSLDFDGTGSGTIGGYQLAQFPMDVLHVTQGENSDFSHLDNYWAMDFVGTHKNYPYYAPVDCQLIHRDNANAIMIWKSQREVMCADGEIRNLVWRNIHDDNLLYSVGKKLKKGELMGATGNSGQSAGDHYHLEVYEDTKYDVATREKTWRHIFDVFAINGVTVINDWGYDWKTSDYMDGDGAGDGSTDDKKSRKKNITAMLLSDALNGWKL
jgi:hypothetical protein